MEDLRLSSRDLSPEAMQAYNEAAFDSYNTKALELCRNCGRTFLPESLLKH